MKKILILAYDFPPYNSVGAQRPYSWFKYLKKYGYHPIVVTRFWDSIQYKKNSNPLSNTFNETVIEESGFGTLIRVPYHMNLRDIFAMRLGGNFSVVRRFLTFIFYVCEFFCFKCDSRREIFFEANRYLLSNKVDFIIASGEPFLLFRYASQLSRIHNIPWIADYRDDWVDSHTDVFKYNAVLKIVRKCRAWLERRFLYNAAAITTVTDFLRESISIRTQVKNSAKIENGVELDNLNLIESAKQTANCFRIVYTGIMYDFHYLKDFVEGFDMFMASINDKTIVSVQFIGILSSVNQCVKDTLRLKERYPENIEIFDNMEYDKVISYQKNASVFLNLIAGDPSLGFLGAKCYQYAALKKPILSVPLVKNNESSFFPNRDINYIAVNKTQVFNFLMKYYNEFVLNKPIQTSINDEEIFLISRENKTKELTSFLNKLYDTKEKEDSCFSSTY
jgi:glycosyltransferase involved in cell wall biosynthesis